MDTKKFLKDNAPGLAWAAVVLAWFLIPLAAKSTGSFPPPPLAAKDLAAMGAGAASILVSIFVWFAVLAAVWKIVSIFLQKKIPSFTISDQIPTIVIDIVSSASVLMVHAIHVTTVAARPSYFVAYPWWAWACTAAALGWNAYALIRLITAFEHGDPNYAQYRQFRHTEKASAKEQKGGIQRRLTLVFSTLLLVIVGVLSAVLLRDFGQTILASVTDNGGAIAEHAATSAKTNAGDNIAISDYFTIEATKNKKASFPFTSLTYYRLDPKKGNFIVAASTLPITTAPKPADNAKAPDALNMLRDQKANTITFQAPVVLGGKVIGYTGVVYEQDVIFAPYFRTIIKVIIIAFLFLYMSIFLTYLIGRGIVAPILFLGMSVNALATRLAAMVGGSERVSADSLRYEDRVGSRDEIKRLSTEIGRMASVIRGVVPYISASTLQHSGRDSPSSERRELAFLFTDIRGFTTLCEGRSPEEVVTLLNRYLDLQTEAILANGGDVDKFVGDEVMAMFDGPEKELNACRAGMAIRKAIAEQQEIAKKNATAVISIGIGVNTGPVVFGSVGARDRMDFTSIGDTVNLAARLEGANKTYGTKSLITESVYNAVKDSFLCREIDLMTVKGKTQPVRIFEVLQESTKANRKLTEIKEGFEQGLVAYRARDWAEAKKLFASVAETYNDEPSAVYLRRAELFELKPPPAEWDGVFSMTVK
ncbi:MAG: adenylate/guanylate cyclase domain-containing protein [Treponemataceae bacterium]